MQIRNSTFNLAEGDIEFSTSNLDFQYRRDCNTITSVIIKKRTTNRKKIMKFNRKKKMFYSPKRTIL